MNLDVNLRGHHESCGLDSDNTTDPVALRLYYFFPVCLLIVRRVRYLILFLEYHDPFRKITPSPDLKVKSLPTEDI